MARPLLKCKGIDPLGVNNMTGTASIVSTAIELFPYDSGRFCFEMSWTGTPTGTFQMEASHQYDPINNPNAVFVPFPNGTNFVNPAFTNPSGGPGSYIGNCPSSCTPKWIRLRYTNSAGTGQLSAWFTARGRD
jgi:hypothetical protein